MKADTDTCVCALLRRNKTFLLARRSAKKRLYPDFWDLPGGHIQMGESTELALLREVCEELGVVPDTYTLIETLKEREPLKNGHGVYVIFLVTAWKGGEPRLANEEHTELRWCSVSEARRLDLADERYLKLMEQISLNLR